MTVEFYDRLTQTKTNQLPPNPIFGQFLVISNSESLLMNSCEIWEKTYLVPNATNRYLLSSTADKFRLEGSFNKWQIAADILPESIRYFEGRLQEIDSWEDWIKVSPLIPGMDKRIEIQPLEKAVGDRLGRLQEVCHRPRTYLKVEIERLPVSRAKRIPPSAASFLASHTEDWERRTLRSVLPKRILSRVQEDLHNIYENRVAKQLIDNLLNYINRRIQELNNLKKLYENAADFSHKTTDIHWRNAERICSLWGEQFEADERVKIAEKTLAYLRNLQSNLRGLIDTELYGAIPPRVYVGTSLKMTNILVNDQHYRHVAFLWREWVDSGGGNHKNALQVFQENQALCRGFEAFCFLLIARALDGFKFENISAETRLELGAKIKFKGPMGEVEIQWRDDGCFCLSMGAEWQDLHLIPLAATLAANTNTKAIESLWENIGNSQHKPYTVILYPSTELEREKLPVDLQRKMNTIGNDRLPKESSFALLPVSPLEIESVERVARSLQWWLNSQRYKSYPPTIKLTKKVPEELLAISKWLKKGENIGEFKILQMPKEEEKQSFKNELHKIMKSTEVRGKASKEELNFEELEKLPNEASDRLQPLQICPACHSEQTRFEVSENSQNFNCFCSNCSSSWGTKSCGACGAKYPFIQVNSIESKQREAGWIDRILGRDVLAIPCWMENKGETFICSECGSCSNATLELECQRCSPV
jgi:hypothetical protein